ncbi:hypothetical protein AVEN_79913-1, partial [Araneus ventricosus]
SRSEVTRGLFYDCPHDFDTCQIARTIPVLVPLFQTSVPPTDDFFYLDVRFKQHQEASFPVEKRTEESTVENRTNELDGRTPPYKIGQKNSMEELFSQKRTKELDGSTPCIWCVKQDRPCRPRGSAMRPPLPLEI